MSFQRTILALSITVGAAIFVTRSPWHRWHVYVAVLMVLGSATVKRLIVKVQKNLLLIRLSVKENEKKRHKLWISVVSFSLNIFWWKMVSQKCKHWKGSANKINSFTSIVPFTLFSFSNLNLKLRQKGLDSILFDS